MMKKIPQDPFICLSFINTQLRDYYPNLDELCQVFGIERKELEEKLGSAGFVYDGGQNQFC